MRNLYSFLLCMCSFIITANAQVTLQQDSTSFNSQMSTAFSNLQTNRVPFGILQDYAMELTNLQAYNGTILADSTKNNYATVMDIYNTLVSGIINTNAGSFLHPVSFDSLWQSKRQAGIITLSGLFYQYSSFLPNAVSSNLITVSNNMIYDKFVNGVWQNPYQTNNVFALSAPLDVYNSSGTYAVKAILPSSLWLSNSSSLVSSLQADFADGLGFRTLTKDQTYNLSYSSGGTKTWTFKLTLTTGTILQSQTDFVFDSTAGGLAMNHISSHSGGLCSVNKIKKLFDFPNGYTDFPHPVTADASYYGQAATGWYTIHYANANGILSHPLVVVEGFDPDDVLKPEEQFGSNNITSFIDQINQSQSGSLINLLTTASTEQYDIIYVDWKHSGDFIERNALLLEKIIGIVNSQSGNAPMVVLGQSMGGLAARWALRDMENKGINHHVRMFISDDAPQQGANVPLAFQYASRQGRSIYYKRAAYSLLNEYNGIALVVNAGLFVENTVRALFNGSPSNYLATVNTDVIRGALSLQDQPSAREMLINYVNSKYQVDNTIHNSWQNSLDYPTTGSPYPQGFPGQPCTLVGVSNGSECAATQPYNAGNALLAFTGNANTRFLGDFVGMLATPFLPTGFLVKNPAFLLALLPGKNTFTAQFTLNAQPDGVAALQYSGKITYQKKLLYLININTTISSVSVTSSPSILPYDYFPGGEEPTNFGTFTNTSNQNILVKYNLNVSAQQPSFCFIPVPSALDIGKGVTALTKADYLTSYVGAFPPTGSKSSPFAGGYTTAFSVVQGSTNNNEQHIALTNRNGDWIYHQIMGTPIVSNCSMFCGYNSIGISGPTQFCGNSNYTLTGTLPPTANTSILWRSNPSGLTFSPMNASSTTASGTIGSTTLTPAITVTEADAEVCGTASPQLSITAGPLPISMTSTAGTCNGNTQTWSLVMNPAAYGNNWNWTVGYLGNSSSIYIYNPNSSSTFVDVTGGGTVNLTYNDICGGSHSDGVTVYSSCHSSNSYLITPNPATSQITVTKKNDKTTTGDNKKVNALNANLYAIKITDQSGVVKKVINFGAGVTSAQISISDLSPGSYFITIFDGTTWNSQVLVIQP
ncbi:MAG: T9SS type A sorting domain-containing protein [Bacteroidota bacterium]|nr:T9SS type A sorting domain-containing protein [Bacteroidota bacterium]